MEIISKKCACKGIRKCLLCDNSEVSFTKNLRVYIYCSKCKNKAYDSKFYEKHLNNHLLLKDGVVETKDSYIEIDGIFLQTEVITDDEEIELTKQIDSFEWVDSQSGRRKQDFGPKINFKKQKINFFTFKGLPRLDVEILEKIRKKKLRNDENSIRFSNNINCDQTDKTILNNFQTVEICHLEYCPERGSSIDAHFDDFWIWGQRLVTLNLLSSTVFTLTLPDRSSIEEYCIRILCPQRSILVLYGDARFRYHHSIQRSDIKDRRLAITYRELPESFFDARCQEKYHIMKEFLNRSKNLISPINLKT